MERKTQKRYVDHSLGFPVVWVDAPLVKARGRWALHVSYNDYQRAILHLLAYKPARLTGNEVQFVRKFFELTVRVFAERFSVKHPAILKWEGKGDASTQMTWSTEKDIRLFILDELEGKAANLRALYRALRVMVEDSSEPIVVNGRDLAA